jgi:hypothetical protein
VHLNGSLQFEQLREGQSKTSERCKLEEVTTALTRGEVRVIALAEGVHFHVGKLLDSIQPTISLTASCDPSNNFCHLNQKIRQTCDATPESLENIADQTG